MPLPDERPRQSVANLIGRFEQQTKRQPTPRTSAVGTADPPNDDSPSPPKERREWPPKSIANTASLDDKPPPYTSFWKRASTANIPLVPAATPPTTVAPTNGTDAPQSVVDTLPQPDLIPPSVEAATEPSESQPKSPVDQPTDLSSSPPANANIRQPQRSPASTVKASNANTPRSSLIPRTPTSVAKSTSRTTSTSLNIPSQPLKPQLTGQSTVSSSARQVTRTPSRSVVPSNRTPSRPKTPANATTTSSPSQRPKTPASGLFAPTAASLARSRNAQPPIPTPTKKVVLSAAAADRLSKPTAASLSKVRAPVTAAATAATVSPPRKAMQALAATRSSPVAETVALSQATPADVPPELVQIENGHHHPEASEESVANFPEIPLSDDLVPDNPATDAIANEELPQQTFDDADDGEAVVPTTTTVPQVFEAESQLTVSILLPSPDPSDIPQEHGQDNKLSSVPTPSPYVASDDIVDMVNLLESGVKSRRLSVVSIPDDVHEIPDEE